jgi:molybdopterin molybdotransferase
VGRRRPVCLNAPMTNKLLDDCFAHPGRRLRHAEVLAILRERVGPVAALEKVSLDDAAGRILGAVQQAPANIPAHTNAAVDGFAFAASDYDKVEGTEFPVGGRAAAGRAFDPRPATATTVRIFTGAVMPQGHDTVAMQEDVALRQRDGRDFVFVPPGLKAGANVRKAGEDVKAGETVLQRGAVLRPQDLAALASMGLSEVECFSRLRVGILSTGDEVVRGDGPLAEGQVYDANAPMLRALATNAGATAIELAILPDRLDAVKSRLAAAAREYDVIITSGGASRGEEDHIAAALDAIGKRHLWQIAIKPGRPMLFGQVGNCAVVGLPGNPVAVFVCFLLYVWPLLRRMGGAQWREPRRYQLPALFAFPGRKVGRREFWRGILKETPRGLAVDKFARDGSGLISGLRAADGLIDIPEDVPEVRPGDHVAFIPFSEFGITGR